MKGIFCLSNFLVLMGLLAGCASGPVHISDTYAARPVPALKESTEVLGVTPEQLPGTCHVYLAQIDDMRQDRDKLGVMDHREIHSPDMQKWIESAMLSLEPYGYRIRTRPSTSDDVTMRVEVIKASIAVYFQRSHSSIQIHTTYLTKDGVVLGTNDHTGIDTSVNWIGSDSEMTNNFGLATQNMLQRIRPILQGYCAKIMAPAAATNQG